MPDDHRFHTVAVLAFKAVYTLEMKRRENDKRILTLYVEYVRPNVDRPSPSHKFQDERHDGGSRAVGVHFHLDVNLSDRSASRLKGVSDPKKIVRDGQTMEERIQKICRDVTENIEDCGNACDTYFK